MKTKIKNQKEKIDKLKPPKNPAELLNIEKLRNPSYLAAYREPYIGFEMKVINKNYSHLKVEKVKINVLYGATVVSDISWERDEKGKENLVNINDLKPAEDGYVRISVPITQVYGDFRDWEVKGNISYNMGDEKIKKDISLRFLLDRKEIKEVLNHLEKIRPGLKKGEDKKVQLVYIPLRKYLLDHYMPDIEKALERSTHYPDVEKIRLSSKFVQFYNDDLLSTEDPEDERLKEDIQSLIIKQYSVLNDPLLRPKVWDDVLIILGKIKKKIQDPLIEYGQG